MTTRRTHEPFQQSLIRRVSGRNGAGGASPHALLAGAVVALTALSGAAAQPTDRRPNFVFILADDQSPESLACYGNRVCRTPHLDRLAREGIVLDDAHHMGSWSGAVCTPSRTMIMTGRTLWRIPGATGPGLEHPPSFRDDAARTSMPALFNQAGYRTFRTCKVGNSYPEANRLFQVRHESTKRDAAVGEGSDWHGDRAVEYLQERAARGDREPFLMFVGFSHPHDPRNAPVDLAAQYGASNAGPPAEPDPRSPPLPPNYLPAHPFHHGHPNLRDEVDVQGVGERRGEAAIRNELGREYACIEQIDRQVGRLLEQLERMGELDNTFVFFTADHGIAVGRHGLMGKQNLYEHSWRVPFLVRGPGIEASRRASGFIYLLDVLPTLCDLAGIAVPESTEGTSFRPVLEGKVDRVRDHVYGAYCGGTKPGIRAIKADRWKLIKYDVLDGQVRVTQLFRLDENPLEYLAEHQAQAVVDRTGHRPDPRRTNLADQREYAGKRKELEDLLRREMTRLGDPYASAMFPDP
ncbi:MAG: DUF229 domain-containing protein [Planctomycetes bacterium]|nr:DUF229 domain-containing protein [Planctomycetota bacterium]